jgi:quercetin dioxygenase-like cupin family protein
VKIIKAGERALGPVNVEGASGVRKAGLISGVDGSPTAAMRLFELDAGGNTPYHTHDWEHVVYVLEGRGTLRSESGEAEFASGDALLTDPGERHSFLNTGAKRLRFLCVVPLRGDA